MKYYLFVALLFGILLTGCSDLSGSSETGATTQMPEPLLPVKQLNVAILIVDGVYNSELVAPMDIFHHTVFHSEKGMKVFTVGPDTSELLTFEGLRIIPDYSWKDSIPSVDILVVPSAEHSMDSDLENQDMMAFVRRTGEEADYLVSLCDGAFVLAAAGLLDGLNCTTFPSDIPRFREMFPQLNVHEGVSFVHDGKAITSAGGAKSYDPALYLSELLYGNKAAKGLGAGLVIDWDVNKVDHFINK